MLEFAQHENLFVLDGVPDTRMYMHVDDICGGTYKDLSALARPFKAQPYAFNRERCGHALWCPKGRMWWDEHDNFFSPSSYFDCGSYILENAVAAAKSARFEHGESGAT